MKHKWVAVSRFTGMELGFFVRESDARLFASALNLKYGKGYIVDVKSARTEPAESPAMETTL